MARFPQQGDDLGTRMAAAFRRVFADGYGSAVIIGTDSPDLPLTYIREACERLQQGDIDAVFGPSGDGGYYLLGMGKFHGGLFRDITWSSDRVLRESLQRAAAEGLRVALLPVWHDVDRPEDLMRPGLRDEDNGAPRTRNFLKNKFFHLSE
jgi:rSAM/selenodomain-associated transferase 1